MIRLGFGSRRGLVLAARFALAGSLLVTVATPARAQDQQAENVAAARSLGIQGVQLADAGKCPEAIEKLSRAESLYHAPTILGRLGECQVAVGQIVLGTENLNRVVREQLPANAPQAFKTAQTRAAKMLEKALPRIAYLTVNVEPPDAKTSVTVAGSPVPGALIGVERPTDPGKREVVATAPGFLEARTEVELAEGGHQAVTLKLVPDPSVAVVVPPPVTTPVPATTEQAPTDRGLERKRKNGRVRDARSGRRRARDGRHHGVLGDTEKGRPRLSRQDVHGVSSRRPR